MRLPTAAALFLAACSLANAAGTDRPKTIFAHYMGCFPVGTGPIQHARDQAARQIRHDASSYVNAMGGRILNWPLVPPNRPPLSPEASAELEIRRAIRGGIDGFAVDAWAGGEGARRTMDALFAAAEKHRLPFKITICLDPNCLPKDPDRPGDMTRQFAEAVKYLLRHRNSPNLARRNGKPLIFGYHSRGMLRTPEMKRMPEGPAQWDRLANAWSEVEKIVGEPLYFYFGLGAFFYGVDRKQIDYVAAASWAGRHFPAVGAFLDESFRPQEKAIAAGVKAGGAEWGQPLWFQYNNRAGSLYIGNGLDILRDRWQLARELDATLIQFVTWNDYGEDTVLAPGYNTGYTILELNRYFIDWWKQGRAPAVKNDKLFLIYRRYPEGCSTYPFKTRRFQPGVLEVVALLQAPGRITLPGRGLAYDAPAGLSFRQFPLRPGEVSAELQRGGRTVIRLAAPEPVTDKPFRADNSMVCCSTEFDRNWQADFGDTPPFRYSEYGDADRDGLPNWFEMYWFGRFLDFTTATAADPQADPDHDGRTNLQEYLAGTDPTRPEAVYKTGDVWDMSTVHRRGSSFNPDNDFHDTPVWYYFYKHGERGKTPRDGQYELCPHSVPHTPYTGPMAHLSPSKDPVYKYIHGWICREKAEDGHWRLVLRPRVQALIVLGWKSPVDGTVSISGKVMPVKGKDGITLEITGENGPLFKQVYDVDQGGEFKVDAVKVSRGRFIYFIADCMPGFDTSKLVLDNLKITLQKKD